MLLEEATEAGLLGASPFFSPRALSRPFSGGECAGLTRGVAGSCERRNRWHPQQRGGLPPALLAGRNCWGDLPKRPQGSPRWRHRPPGHRSCHHRCPETHRESHPAESCKPWGGRQPPAGSQTPPAAGHGSPTPRVRSFTQTPLSPTQSPVRTRAARGHGSAPAAARPPLTYRLMLSFSSAFRFLESML